MTKRLSLCRSCKGQEITVPGEEISSAIKKLGKLGLFDEISFYINRIKTTASILI
jgi:outer membrane protein insertion porin family